ncbi:MAG: hypothetical protein ACE5KG_06675 [Nitrososphaerales archaeon]
MSSTNDSGGSKWHVLVPLFVIFGLMGGIFLYNDIYQNSAWNVHLVVEDGRLRPSEINIGQEATVTLSVSSLDRSQTVYIPNLGVSLNVPRDETAQVRFHVDELWFFIIRCSHPTDHMCGQIQVVSPQIEIGEHAHG